MSKVTLPDIQEQDHPVMQQHLYAVCQEKSEDDTARRVVATHGKVGSS